VALRTLDACGIADVVIPGYSAAPADERAARLAVLDGHDTSPSAPEARAALGLATLLDDEAATERVLNARLDRLRASRAMSGATREGARLARGLDEVALPGAQLATKRRALRAPGWVAALDLALRRASAKGRASDGLQALAVWREQAPDPAPVPLLRAADLAALGLAPGPRFGQLLSEAEDLQLEGALTTRDEALRWLDARVESV
jgi:hypothetical protein